VEAALARRGHNYPAELFLVVADTTDLVTGLRVEEGLLEHLACGMAREPVGGLFYRSLGGILHNRVTEPSTVHVLKVSQLFVLISVRMRRYDPVRGVGAGHIKIAVPHRRNNARDATVAALGQWIWQSRD